MHCDWANGTSTHLHSHHTGECYLRSRRETSEASLVRSLQIEGGKPTAPEAREGLLSPFLVNKLILSHLAQSQCGRFAASHTLYRRAHHIQFLVLHWQWAFLSPVYKSLGRHLRIGTLLPNGKNRMTGGVLQLPRRSGSAYYVMRLL